MTDTPKMITIQSAGKSKNNKWLLVYDQMNVRYLSTCWELESMVGSTIFGQTGSKQTDDGVIHFLNSWQYPEGWPTMPEGQQAAPPPHPGQPPMPVGPGPSLSPSAGGPPLQAPPPIQTPVQHPQAPIRPQPQPGDPLAALRDAHPKPQPVDRDASIVAQTLCKTVTFSSPRAAWRAYMDFYALYTQTPWMNVTPPADPAEGPWQGEAEANEQAQNQGFDDDVPF